MAIVNNGTVVNIPTALQPSGFTRAGITEVSADYDYAKRFTLTVLKATVENATPATTLTNIIDNATIGVEKQIDDIMAADFLATAAVTHSQDIIAVSSNISAIASGDFWNATAVSYVVTVDVYIKAA